MHPQDLTPTHRALLGRAYWADAVWLGHTTEIDQSRYDDHTKAALRELVAAGFLRSEDTDIKHASEYLVLTPAGKDAWRESNRIEENKRLSDWLARNFGCEAQEES